MPEEATGNSLSDDEIRKRGTPEAVEESRTLEELDVFDANGERLGRVTKGFVEDGALVSLEVRLDRQMARVLDVADEFVTRVDPADVTGVEADGVRLAKAAAQVVEGARPVDDRSVDRGSGTFPRDTR